MDVEDPLSGWPTTQPLAEGEGFRIDAKHLTPGRAWLADFFALTVLVATLVLFGWVVLDGSFVDPGLALAVLAPVWFVGGTALAAGRKAVGRRLFGKTTVIEFHPDVVRIKGMRGFKNYDRMLPHEFTVEEHERAEREKIQEFKAQRKAEMARKTELPEKERYFRDSFLVVLRYAGQRVPIATVYGKKWAEGLLMRLQLLDQFMDAMRGEIGEPVLSEPSKQYGERPDAG